MARQSKTTPSAKRAPGKTPALASARPRVKAAAKAPAPADNRDELSVADLARGVLSKDIRPRAGDVRRLAEAVLAGGKPKKTKKAKADDKKAKGKKKLAKIPGQRAKK
jgi:hypothetical protein